MHEDVLPALPVRDGAAKRRGVQYEVANSSRIPNPGEKRFIGITDEGVARKIAAQVCEVDKAFPL